MFDFTKKQFEAITVLDNNVSVSAGAGSGKTRVLVERFVNILKQGLLENGKEVKATDILAITFTRKAASEMKERVRRRLTDLEQEDDANALFWRKQLELLEQARINTIHGFCNSLLKENPVEAALDPSFQVAEEVEMDEFLAKTLQQFVRQGLRQGDKNILRLADEYTADGVVAQLLTVQPKLENILVFGDLLKPYQASLGMLLDRQEKLKILLQELASGRENITARVHRQKLDLLSENLQELLQAVENIELSESWALLDRYVACLTATSKDRDIVKETKDILQQLKLAVYDKAALELLPCWQQVIKDCAAYLRQQQELNNMLGFDDLESRALELLEKHPQVCARNNNRYQYIMVDEFQDTNERQRQLVYLLCGGSKDELRGKKLFVVGDAKQSIYRFRGADVSVFANVQRDIKRLGGCNITLDDNFRSVDKVLDLCNLAFAVLLGEDVQQDVYFEALNANRSTDLLPEMLVINYDKMSKSQRREAEAAAVAGRILELHEKENVPYKDMVLLLNALTTSKTFAATLQQAGIPYNIVDGKGFYERQEIIDLINLLIFLEDGSRSLELAGVLRSPYFAVDDECLTALFLAVNENDKKLTLWQQLQQETFSEIIVGERKIMLRDAVVTLQKLRQYAETMPLPELLRAIVERLHLEPLLASQEFGMEKVANLKKMIALAEAFTVSKHGTLADYLIHLEQLRQAQARESSAIDLTDSNAVTIMTIHKSKGLEFPVVFLPTLDAKGRNDTDMLRFNEKLGLGIKIEIDGELQDTGVMTSIKETEKLLTTAEKQRQLYVAMTRAKDRLILSGAYDPTSKSESDNWFSSLRKILQAKDYTQILLREYDAAKIETLVGTEQIEDTIQITDDLLEQIRPLPEYGLGWQRNLSPTALQTYLHCPRSYYYKYVKQMPEYDLASEVSGDSNVLPADIQGTIIHKALELLTNGYGQEQAFNAALQGSNIEKGASKTKKLYLDYLVGELYQKFAAADKKSEINFGLPLLAEFGINTIFTGCIDCTVFNSDGTLMVIDYKTGRVPQNNEPQEGYIYQLALYQKAAAYIWQKPVQQSELHFLQNNFCWELPKAEDDILREAAELCKEIFSKRTEEEFAVEKTACSYCPFRYFCRNDEMDNKTK